DGPVFLFVEFGFRASHITLLEVTPGRTPFVIKDVVDAAPMTILVGRGHVDHAENAAYLAATSLVLTINRTVGNWYRLLASQSFEIRHWKRSSQHGFPEPVGR